MYTTLIGGSSVEPMLVPKIKNSVFQTLVIHSWSVLGKKKQFQVSADFPGLKIESDSGISSIPAIKGKLGLFGLSNLCQTVCSVFSSGMGHWFFLIF